jgi:ATP-dependent helicase HrpB
MAEPLPIDPLVPEIVRRLRASSSLVLRAPTGAGKTTRVAPALLELGRVLLLEPRRLAARAAARRMAFERDVRLGSAIGYHVRFDRQAGAATRLLVVTPGILLRLLHDDPALEAFDVVVFDEFHERGIDSDLALGMTRLVQQTVRPELRIVVMSATLDTAEAAGYLGDCAVVASEGRLHPVTIRYEPPPARQPISTNVAEAIRRLDPVGDVLAFLPGVGEIRQTAGELESWARDSDTLVVPLYGDLPAEQQDIALVPQTRRKIVLATNVAETSITVEGVAAVVDSGLARQLEYDPAVGMDRLKLLPISRASSDQRAGRAGRTGPGVCVRLWNEIDQRSRTERTEPEIRRVDLAGPLLQLLALGEANGFPWLEAPKPAALEQARTLLNRLEATSNGALKDLGRAMARLPVHPRLARFLLEAAKLGCAEHAALAAALLSERDPFLRDTARAVGPTRSDLLDRAHAVADYERSGRTSTPHGSLHVAGARFVLRARDQLLRTLRQETDVADTTSEDEPILRALLAAYPDRLARRREPGSRRAVMVGGRGVKLLPASGVTEGELFLCLDVDAGATETLVRQASAVERDWLDRLETAIVVSFDEASERVVARKQVRFEDLVIEESPANSPSDAETARVLVDAAVSRLERVLPEPDSAAGSLLVRIRWLREFMPELELPAFEEADLREALGWLAPGKKSFADLRRADWVGVLMGRLTPRQRHAVDREAPERIEVPSGSRIAVVYDPGKPPVLAVRVQEVFGLADTPRIAGGRVKVVLHLLAPNGRPQQVTDDLASFWANTYPIVRKDLRARYPKHAWPEDPTTAPALRGPKRR